MQKSPLKRAVRVWLAEHDKTQVWLADKLGIHSGALSHVLAGYRPLTEELADDIHRITGLDIEPYVRRKVSA